MLIWLASYPRSGSTLVRQVLWHTMGYVSYDETQQKRPKFPDYARLVSDDFADFDDLRRSAAQSSEPVFVKTHRAPVDANRAIYVVRDGRSTITSFLKYERRFWPESEPSLLSLIAGDHPYGSWSDHYDAWHEAGERELLTVRYDELFDADEHVLERIAAFVGFDGEIRAWENPIDYWRQKRPEVVGEGKTYWDAPPEWDAVSDAVFWSIHGELMNALGFGSPLELGLGPVERARLEEMAARYHALAAEVRSLRAAAQPNTGTIATLEAERDRQSAAAAERLEALTVLKAEHEALVAAWSRHEQELTGERDQQAGAAAERLSVIAELQQELDVQRTAAKERLETIDVLEAEIARLRGPA